MFFDPLIARFGVGSLLALPLAGCDTLPPLERGPAVSTSQIVERVKCELAQAVEPYLRKGNPFPWFQKWTAEIDLTLVVTDQTGLTPSVAFIEPLRNAVFPGISSIVQNFTFGASAGLNSTATRTEQLSFAIALKDAPAELKNPNCSALPNIRDLNANLGMSEWIESAFEPIAFGQLKQGTQKLPAQPKKLSVAPPLPPPKATSTGMTIQSLRESPTGQKELDALIKSLPSIPAKDKTATVADFLDKFNKIAYTLIDLSITDIDNFIKVIDRLKKNLDAIGKTDKAGNYNVPKTLDNTQVEIPTSDGLDHPGTLREYAGEIRQALLVSKEWAKSQLPPPKPALEDPIEVIGHQVSFIIAVNGGVGPNWTLAKFKGPVQAGGNLVGGTRTRSHGLVITLGPPGSAVAQSNRGVASLASALRSSGVTVLPNATTPITPSP
jgi:hypothetical protein